ncbi:hypothetical protein ACP70R_000968 [Stipagrostis hirtigluma subsp. patula]
MECELEERAAALDREAAEWERRADEQRRFVAELMRLIGMPERCKFESEDIVRNFILHILQLLGWLLQMSTRSFHILQAFSGKKFAFLLP